MLLPSINDDQDDVNSRSIAMMGAVGVITIIVTFATFIYPYIVRFIG
jgi:hypothetical protein